MVKLIKNLKKITAKLFKKKEKHETKEEIQQTCDDPNSVHDLKAACSISIQKNPSHTEQYLITMLKALSLHEIANNIHRALLQNQNVSQRISVGTVMSQNDLIRNVKPKSKVQHSFRGQTIQETTPYKKQISIEEQSIEIAQVFLDKLASIENDLCKSNSQIGAIEELGKEVARIPLCFQDCSDATSNQEVVAKKISRNNSTQRSFQENWGPNLFQKEAVTMDAEVNAVDSYPTGPHTKNCNCKKKTSDKTTEANLYSTLSTNVSETSFSKCVGVDLLPKISECTECTNKTNTCEACTCTMTQRGTDIKSASEGTIDNIKKMVTKINDLGGKSSSDIKIINSTILALDSDSVSMLKPKQNRRKPPRISKKSKRRLSLLEKSDQISTIIKKIKDTFIESSSSTSNLVALLNENSLLRMLQNNNGKQSTSINNSNSPEKLLNEFLKVDAALSNNNRTREIKKKKPKKVIKKIYATNTSSCQTLPASTSDLSDDSKNDDTLDSNRTMDKEKCTKGSPKGVNCKLSASEVDFILKCIISKDVQKSENTINEILEQLHKLWPDKKQRNKLNKNKRAPIEDVLSSKEIGKRSTKRNMSLHQSTQIIERLSKEQQTQEVICKDANAQTEPLYNILRTPKDLDCIYLDDYFLHPKVKSIHSRHNPACPYSANRKRKYDTSNSTFSKVSKIWSNYNNKENIGYLHPKQKPNQVYYENGDHIFKEGTVQNFDANIVASASDSCLKYYSDDMLARPKQIKGVKHRDENKYYFADQIVNNFQQESLKAFNDKTNTFKKLIKKSVNEYFTECIDTLSRYTKMHKKTDLSLEALAFLFSESDLVSGRKNTLFKSNKTGRTVKKNIGIGTVPKQTQNKEIHCRLLTTTCKRGINWGNDCINQNLPPYDIIREIARTKQYRSNYRTAVGWDDKQERNFHPDDDCYQSMQYHNIDMVSKATMSTKVENHNIQTNTLATKNEYRQLIMPSNENSGEINIEIDPVRPKTAGKKSFEYKSPHKISKNHDIIRKDSKKVIRRKLWKAYCDNLKNIQDQKRIIQATVEDELADSARFVNSNFKTKGRVTLQKMLEASNKPHMNHSPTEKPYNQTSLEVLRQSYAAVGNITESTLKPKSHKQKKNVPTYFQKDPTNKFQDLKTKSEIASKELDEVTPRKLLQHNKNNEIPDSRSSDYAKIPRSLLDVPLGEILKIVNSLPKHSREKCKPVVEKFLSCQAVSSDSQKIWEYIAYLLSEHYRKCHKINPNGFTKSKEKVSTKSTFKCLDKRSKSYYSRKSKPQRRVPSTSSGYSAYYVKEFFSSSLNTFVIPNPKKSTKDWRKS